MTTWPFAYHQFCVFALLLLYAIIIVAVLLYYHFNDNEKWHPETPRGGVGSDFVSEKEGEW